MTKVYNTQEEIANNLTILLKNIFNDDIRKTQLNILPYIILGMINAESSVASDIAKKLKGDFSLVQIDSVIKRIKRLYTNKFFDPYYFYDKVIKYVISNYKLSHSDKRVHIIFDHMFSHDNYTVFMITLRIGKQGVPIWFRCFPDKDCSDAFQESLLKEGISYVSSLFDDSYELIFLADRWFNSVSIMKHINSLGHTFCIRLKGNLNVLVFDKKENHKIWKSLSELKAWQTKSKLFENISITNHEFSCNITISKSNGVAEPWLIATNGNPNRAIKDYGYRFGAIECVFKNQKSNGFYIESTVNASLKYFESMYALTCFATLFLTILGTEFSKNCSCYKHVKITTHKIFNGTKKRILSLFNTGLTLFNLAFNSSRYIRLPFTLILYDI